MTEEQEKAMDALIEMVCKQDAFIQRQKILLNTLNEQNLALNQLNLELAAKIAMIEALGKAML
jgi:hypothetical protein